MLLTELLYIRHVSIVGNNHTGLALDGLDHEGSDVGPILLKLGLQTGQVVILDTREARHIGTKSSVGRRVIGTGNSRQSAAPEVVAGKDNAGLVLWDALDIIAPPTGKLDGGFAALHSSIHWEDAVVAKVGGNKLGILTKSIIVEGTGRERELLGLLDQCADDFGMAMPLIDGAVGRQEIKVLPPIDV